MMKDLSLFGLRFSANENLHPTQEDISAFLQSRKREGQEGLHADDLTAYDRMMEDIEAFERRRQEGGAQDLRQKMFYNALAHSSFFHPGLLSAVEHYKYHVHALLTLDFRKPAAFIKSAEEEMSRLNQKKKDDAVKLARLQRMAGERRKTVEALKQRRDALAGELEDIARYIRDNLTEIKKICKASISVLADILNARQEEGRLIEDIKIHFKERLRNALHQGQITQQHLESAKADVAALSKELTSLLQEDVHTLSGLYEAILNHTQKAVSELEALLAKIESQKGRSAGTDGALFGRIEQALVSLVSGHRFDLQPVEVSTETAHKDILAEKRKEAIDHILVQLPRERRTRRERRSGEERSQSDDPGREGPQRRSGKDRRS
ncbi:MAG TPA: hypothetical protein VF903_07995 [Nitrospirota bacterium]